MVAHHLWVDCQEQVELLSLGRPFEYDRFDSYGTVYKRQHFKNECFFKKN